MAIQSHVEILGLGAPRWNEWRRANPTIIPDLSGFGFSYTHNECPDLNGVDLSGAILRDAGIYGPDRDWPGETAPTFENSNLRNADMRGISMFRTFFTNANLRGANLADADITSVGFQGADLTGTSFTRAKLDRVGFSGAIVVDTNFEGATLHEVEIPDFGTWRPITDSKTVGTAIAITSQDEATISVDDLDVAQFVSLLLNTEKLRKLLEVTTERMVLVLGCFETERKEILDLVRTELRTRGYIAIVFDFERPTRRDLTETIALLAQLSRFVIADITDAKSVPQELQAVVPNLPSVAFQPILHENGSEYGMFEHFSDRCE
jgi:uncharacterized protein YjbI with pentapeptide repeats